MMKLKSLLLLTLISYCTIYSNKTYAHNAHSNYVLKVYLKNQIIDVFRNGKLIKEMLCSTGMQPGSTPQGTFKTYAREEKIEVGKSKVRMYYITRFNNFVSFHSLLEGNHRVVRKGKKLYKDRKPSSLGCIRMKKKDAKWIYDLPLGATVHVIDGT